MRINKTKFNKTIWNFILKLFCKPRVICDTMIWYDLSNGVIDKNKYSCERFTTTQVNIHEAATSFNLLDKENEVRLAIKEMIAYSKEIIYVNPFEHLLRLTFRDFKSNISNDYGELLIFTQKIAKGHEIEKSKMPSFKIWLQEMEKPLEDFADFTNQELARIRINIQDKKKHRTEDATGANRQLISSWVSNLTQGKYDLTNFDWSQAELFDRTMTSFFKELELSQMKMQANDVFDLFSLMYVQPGDKYFTKEKRWLNQIKIAGMEKYLFQN